MHSANLSWSLQSTLNRSFSIPALRNTTRNGELTGHANENLRGLRVCVCLIIAFYGSHVSNHHNTSIPICDSTVHTLYRKCHWILTYQFLLSYQHLLHRLLCRATETSTFSMVEQTQCLSVNWCVPCLREQFM